MQIPPLPNRIKASDLPPDQMIQNPHLSEEEKIHEVSRQFEAVLLRQILQNAQKPVFPTTCALNSSVSGIYQDMTNAQLAESISKSGAFGLARTLEEQLTRQLSTRTDAAPVPAPADQKVTLGHDRTT